jgi:hypothetical protein
METKTNSADIVRRQTGEVAPHALLYPIKLKDGTELTTLHLRRPTGREMRNIDAAALKKPYDMTLQMVETLCSLTREEADSLDAADVTKLMEIVLPFLADGIGEKPSA